jgi:molybdopterin-binding protein
VDQNKEDDMKFSNISARNILAGTVKDVAVGAVNAEVTVQLPGGAEVVSVITKDSAERLKLKSGAKVFAVIKASDVILATE